jgi:hypothetical protein
MRRLRIVSGTEWDELPGGLFRRRLEKGEDRRGKTPHPKPVTLEELRGQYGDALFEVDTVALESRRVLAGVS